MRKRRKPNNQLRQTLSNLRSDGINMMKSAASFTPLGPAISLYDGGKNAQRLANSTRKSARALHHELTCAIRRKKKQYRRRLNSLIRFSQ